ncbi:DUF3460 family protein [Leeia sp.]|uniref:DUF3460 family protein n=1 Tax=Leeia sp. TaxID=2884678 RepID=UPI0035AFAE64
MYQSEFTDFINRYLEQNPQVAAERLERRAVWWDKPVDATFEKGATEAKVKQNGYYYQGYVYSGAPKKKVDL